MILWIVEDDDKQLEKLLQAVKEEFPKIFRIHVNRDIAWPKDRTLPKLEPDPGVRQPSSPQHLPDIVVLDLLLEGSGSRAARNRSERPDFPGSLFYERLREEEGGSHKRPSQVIVYSQFRGLACTENFVEECRAVDRRFDDVVKSPRLLVEKLSVAKQKVLDGE